MGDCDSDRTLGSTSRIFGGDISVEFVNRLYSLNNLKMAAILNTYR